MRAVRMLAVCAVLLCCACAQAGVIGTWTQQMTDISTEEIVCAASMSLGDDMADMEGRTTLFNGPDPDGFPDFGSGVDIYGNIGSTVWIASNEDDPDFGEFVSRITDGVPDNVQAQSGCEGWYGGWSYWIPIYIVRGWPDVYDYNFDHADLSGYAVERFGLRVDWATYTFVPGAQNPHQYDWQVTYIFEGTPVPEPASVACVAAGIGLLIPRVRRRWRG